MLIVALILFCCCLCGKHAVYFICCVCCECCLTSLLCLGLFNSGFDFSLSLLAFHLLLSL